MINYGYFRHRFDAHTDNKMMTLKEKGGLTSIACYFILLEIYGKAYSDDSDKKIEQEINLRHIANSFGLRSDSTRTQIELISNCNLIDAVWSESDTSSVKVGIPNFLKYFGSYKKTDTEKALIKTNKIKTNKIKVYNTVQDEKIVDDEKKPRESASKKYDLFSRFSNFPEELKEFLLPVKTQIQEEWWKKWHIELIKDELEEARLWTISKDHKHKNLASFMNNWFRRCNHGAKELNSEYKTELFLESRRKAREEQENVQSTTDR